MSRRSAARLALVLTLWLLAGCLGAQQFSRVRYAGKQYLICTVDLSQQKLSLFWRDAQKRPLKSFEAVNRMLATKGRKLTFAMNAGMYREDYSPVGLYVENGKQLRALNLANGSGNFCLKPNGVFAVTKSGARIVESSQYPTIKATTTLATQSGPMLVIAGKLHPKFSRLSPSRLYRNGVGVRNAKTVLFVLTESPVNLYEFAQFYRDKLKCPNALYLDGTISSLYAPVLKRNDCFVQLGPIIGTTKSVK